MSLVAAAPERGFSVAELVRETGVSRATAHAVVGQLVTAGWLHRDATGTVTIGRTFAALCRGLAAVEPLAALARPHLQALSARVGCPVCLVERDGDAVVITDRVGDADPALTRGPQLGDAAPFRAPYGREFVAWNPPPAWWGRRVDDSRLRAVLHAIRSRGYSVDRLGEDTAHLLRTLSTAPETTQSIAHQIAETFAESTVLDVLDGELRDGELYRVITVAAPVFDADAAVCATVSIAAQRRLSAREIERYGDAAVAVGAAITTEWGGRKPNAGGAPALA